MAVSEDTVETEFRSGTGDDEQDIHDDIGVGTLVANNTRKHIIGMTMIQGLVVGRKERFSILCKKNQNQMMPYEWNRYKAVKLPILQ